MKQQLDDITTKQAGRERAEDESIVFSYTLKKDEQPDQSFFDTIQKAVDNLYNASKKNVGHNNLFVTVESSVLLPGDSKKGKLDLTQEKEGSIILLDVTDTGHKIEIPIKTLRSIVIRKNGEN